tara:strand:+ start:960 stop:2177 length:1218 start_codon:yes stop_codon:yes gene_type:complete
MKYRFKIYYTFLGGSSSSSSSSSIIPYASDNNPSNTGDEFNWFRYRPEELQRELNLFVNGGLIESGHERNGIRQTKSFSQQCMYISIYDYLTLKQNFDGSFEDFKRSIDPNKNTPDNMEWDEFNTNHKEVLRKAAVIYELDIRIWQRSFFDPNYLDQGNNFFDLDRKLIRPRYREGAGNINIVNVAANIRHFELIIGGSIFGNNDTYNTQIQAQDNRGIQKNDNEFIDLYNDIINNLNTGNAFDYLDKINKLKQEEYDALYDFELKKKSSDLTEEEKKQIRDNVDNYFRELVLVVEELFDQEEPNPNTSNYKELETLPQIEEQETDINKAVIDRILQEEIDEQIAENIQNYENTKSSQNPKSSSSKSSTSSSSKSTSNSSQSSKITTYLDLINKYKKNKNNKKKK